MEVWVSDVGLYGRSPISIAVLPAREILILIGVEFRGIGKIEFGVTRIFRITSFRITNFLDESVLTGIVLYRRGCT